MPATSATSRSYGAVVEGDADPAVVDSPFDASDTYYLTGGNSSGGHRLTRSERIRKCLLVSVPLLAAAIIVGGAALFLLRDFNNLYPGHGGSLERGGPGRIEHASTSSGDSSALTKGGGAHSPPSSSSSGKTVVGGGAACANHAQCADAGLLGNCCPTPEGIQLDCCS